MSRLKQFIVKRHKAIGRIDIYNSDYCSQGQIVIEMHRNQIAGDDDLAIDKFRISFDYDGISAHWIVLKSIIDDLERIYKQIPRWIDIYVRIGPGMWYSPIKILSYGDMGYYSSPMTEIRNQIIALANESSMHKDVFYQAALSVSNGVTIAEYEEKIIKMEEKARQYESDITKLCAFRFGNDRSNRREPDKTYLLFDGRYYKIGKAIDPIRRLKDIKSHNPSVALIHSIDRDIERDLHLRYKDKRVHNEWFDLSSVEVAEIMEIS